MKGKKMQNTTVYDSDFNCHIFNATGEHPYVLACDALTFPESEWLLDWLINNQDESIYPTCTGTLVYPKLYWLGPLYKDVGEIITDDDLDAGDRLMATSIHQKLSALHESGKVHGIMVDV
jgi:hypothetical protein